MSVLSKPLRADHLLAIFTRVPIATLVRLPLVCTAWSSLQPTACRQTHTLSLNITKTGTYIAGAHLSQAHGSARLHLPLIGFPRPPLPITHTNGTLPPTAVTSLLSLFPFIRNLYLDNAAFKYIKEDLPPETSALPLTRLIRGWSQTLTRLAICGFYIPCIGDIGRLQLHASASLRCLLSAINTLPLLRHLTIDVYAHFRPSYTTLPFFTLRLSALAHLETLTFASKDEDALILLPSLIVYGNVQTLTQIRLGTEACTLIQSLAQQGSPLLGRITSCAYSGNRKSPALLGAHLPNLTSLILLISPPNEHTLGRLFSSLGRCTQLRTLILGLSHWSDDQVIDAKPEITPLPLLTSFTLFIFTLTSHTLLLEYLPLATLFPALTFFTLESVPNECTACGFTLKTSVFSLEERSLMRNCVQKILAPLKACTQLKKITIPNFADKEINVCEIPTWEEIPAAELGACDRLLCSEVNSETVVHCLLYAHSHSMPELLERSLRYILMNKAAVMARQEWPQAERLFEELIGKGTTV